MPVRVLLLVRGVARRQDAREIAALAMADIAGSTKIQQHRRTVLADINIVGLDIAMDIARLVNQTQATIDRQKDVQQRCLGWVRVFSQPLVEVMPGLIVHHQIGGAEFAEVGQHPRHVGVIELHQRARFLQKAAKTVAKEFFALRGERTDGQSVITTGRCRRQVLFDRHQSLQLRLFGQISQAESATPEQADNAVMMN